MPVNVMSFIDSIKSLLLQTRSDLDFLDLIFTGLKRSLIGAQKGGGATAKFWPNVFITCTNFLDRSLAVSRSLILGSSKPSGSSRVPSNLGSSLPFSSRNLRAKASSPLKSTNRPDKTANFAISLQGYAQQVSQLQLQN